MLLSFGEDRITFKVRSDTLKDIELSYDGLEACVRDCESRIFGGTHYRFSYEEGMTLGKQVAS